MLDHFIDQTVFLRLLCRHYTITFDIKFPTHLSDKQKGLLRDALQ